jgi:hypothetical protein
MSVEETLSRLEAERRLDPAVTRTASYLFAASLLDEEKDIMQEARKRLRDENPRELYLAFLKESIHNLKQAEQPRKYRFARQIGDVGVMGLGIWQEDLGISAAGQRALRISGEPDWNFIKDHINQTVFGDYFLRGNQRT